MAFSSNKEFKYSFRGLNKIIEEKGNQYIRLSEIAWAGADEEVPPEKIKLDLRKYTTDADGNEKMLKGVSFMTPEGPHELTNILVEEGYGDSERILNAVKNRNDFRDVVDNIWGGGKASKSDTFDLRDLL